MGPIRTFTPAASDIDSFIEPLVILSGDRSKIEQEQIPACFSPVTGKWQMRGAHGRIQLGTLLTYLQICIRPLLTMRATTLAMARRMNFTASIRGKELLQLSAQTNVRVLHPSNLSVLTLVQMSLW
jgi:hypothetical protein